jgi:arylsulfatase A-like enzyme
MVAMGLLFSGDRLLTDNPQAEAQTTGGPNIVFVMAGFLDKRFMQDHPGRREIMNTNGTTFENAYVTYFLCWPSRATILRGQYSHNHKIIGNSLPEGGEKKFRNLGSDRSTIATWFNHAGS